MKKRQVAKIDRKADRKTERQEVTEDNGLTFRQTDRPIDQQYYF